MTNIRSWAAAPTGHLATLFLAAGLAQACATSRHGAAALVREADAGMVRNCTYVGEVHGTSGWGGLAAGVGIDNAKNGALKRASKLKATHVVWSSIEGGYMPQVSGAAYRCEDTDGRPEGNATSPDQGQGARSGTAWVCARGVAVTNEHVVGANKLVTLVRTDGSSAAATVLLRDRANDLVLLRVDDEAWLPAPLPIAKEGARVGQRVFTVGYPLPEALGTVARTSEGIISAPAGLQDDPRTYQISVPVQPGNSGGPLLDMHGRVVGVVTSKLNAAAVFQWVGDIPQNVNFAVKAVYVVALLQGSGHVAQGAESGEFPLEQLVAQAQPSVLLVTSQ